MLLVVFLFTFFGLVYNLNWLSRILFSSSLNIVFVNRILKYNQFYILLFVFLCLFPFIFIFFIL
jgi:hypothetical protein